MHKSKAVSYALITAIFLILQLHLSLAFAYPKYQPRWSAVEKRFLAASGRQSVYPNEYMAVLEVRNQYELGRLTALRFIEWAADHPNGVVSLTSGTTPEYFIKFLSYYKHNWHSADVQKELHSFGIKLKNFPNTSNLRFVQIEEFYPMSVKHKQKVSNYLLRHYVKLLNLKRKNVLLMDVNKTGIIAEKGMKVVFMNGKIDLSIMDHQPNSQLESWQQQAIKELRSFCAKYEQRIREWGGIDFFLGGISYAGHLGFNQPGTSINSTTHMLNLDYNTAAHAAKDLGGIEHARGKIGITIGLGTITLKPQAVMILIASGEAKAGVIRDSVERKFDPQYPTTLLQNYPNSRFYITTGAAKLLNDRRTEDFRLGSKHGWTRKQIEDVIVEIALQENKAIIDLDRATLEKHERGRLLLQNPPKPLEVMLFDVRNDLTNKIAEGLNMPFVKANTILHTGPHHDDIMLGYYPLIENLLPKYHNLFAYFTSGSNSVSDMYIMTTINRASDWWLNNNKKDIFDKNYEKILNRFPSFFVKQDTEQMAMLDTIILLRHIATVYDIKTLDQLKNKIRWLKDEYFPSKYQGDMSDTLEIKYIKGMMRESEVEKLWSIKKISLKNIIHLRSKFYFGHEFCKTPRIEKDVNSFVALLNDKKPDIITVADDPQSAPPATHYKTLQIVAQALRSENVKLKDKLQIWGYRNIWFRYSIPEANVYIPVSAKMLEQQKQEFLSCFNTQKMSSFPSPFFEADFAAIMDFIQREQLRELKILLGENYFNNSHVAALKNAQGMIFLHRMNLDTLLQRAEDLGKSIDLEKFYENNEMQ